MRTLFWTLVLLSAATIGAAFYFGLCTASADRVASTYVVSLVVHPDILVPKHADESAQDNIDEQSLDAKGRIASINAAKNEFVLTENFKDLKFKLENNATVLLNGQSSKLADLRNGDEASVTYSRQAQQLIASVVNCTRKSASD